MTTPINKDNRYLAFKAAHATAHPKTVTPMFISDGEPPRPYDFSQIQSNPVRVVHPCTKFAVVAGYASWNEAVTAMKAGKILVGPSPTFGKSTIEFQLFYKQISQAGLFTMVDDFSRMAVGYRENFPDETLARADAESAQLAARVQSFRK